MILNDKEIRKQLNSLYHLVLALARMQGIDGEQLVNESMNAPENIEYMLKMFKKEVNK
jgi:hypothetical protein